MFFDQVEFDIATERLADVALGACFIPLKDLAPRGGVVSKPFVHRKMAGTNTNWERVPLNHEQILTEPLVGYLNPDEHVIVLAQ